MDADLHETHVCRDCGASITLPYAAPAVTETDLRAAARHLSRFAGRYLAGDSDVQPDDVQSAIEGVRAALATDTEEAG